MDISSLIDLTQWQFSVARTGLLAIVLLLFVLTLSRWRRAGRRDMQELFTQLHESRGQTQSLAELAQQLANQIAALQNRIEDRQQLQMAAAGGAQRGYELALKLASHGADAEDIVSATGVTRHEAQLLMRLHNPKRD
jgi:uncharacterized protein YlxW (UPF0749 family)